MQIVRAFEVCLCVRDIRNKRCLLFNIRRDQIQGRMHNVVSSLSMVYGLVFSGVAGSALTPMSVQEFGEGTSFRTLANL